MTPFTLLEEEKKNKFTLLEESKFILPEEEIKKEIPISTPPQKIENEQKFTLLQEQPIPTTKFTLTNVPIPDYSTTKISQQLKEGNYVPEYKEPELTLKDVGKAIVKGTESGALLGYTPLFEEYKPDTALEKGVYYSSQLAGFILPATAVTKLVGAGFGGLARLVPILSKIPTGVKIVGLSTATGAILGGLKKPEGKETRLTGAIKTGALFGVTTVVGLGVQKILAARSIARLNMVLGKVDEIENKLDLDWTNINLNLSKKQILENPDVAKLLEGLKSGDKTVVLNIIKGRQGLPIELRQGWYEKHIGNPLYNKVVNFLDAQESSPAKFIKKQLVYRYGQPEEWATAAEQRLVDIAVGKDKAGAIGKLLSEKLNESEANDIVATLGRTEPDLAGKLVRDTPLSQAESMRVMQIIKGSISTGIRPDLAIRAQIAREEIDNLSKELTNLPIPEETKQIITNNLGTYVRRMYTTEEGKEGFWNKLFAPLRLKGQKTFLQERGGDLKEAFRNDILTEQNIVNKELKSLNIFKIEGVGGVTGTRLQYAGYRTVESLENATVEDLMNITGIGETTANKIIAQAKIMSHNTRALESRLGWLDFRLNKDITRIDFPAEVRKTLGEITTSGYPVVRTVNSMVNDIETSKLFDFAANNPNLSTDDIMLAAEKGWTQLSDLASLGRLRNRFVPQGVADDIQYIQRISNESEKLYLKMLSMWKFTKVPMNPATHFRNIMSNVMLLDASGTPLTRQPGVVSVAFEEWLNKGKFYQMAKTSGAFTGEFTDVEINDLLNNWNATNGSMLERVTEFAGKKLAFKDMTRLYQAEEGIFKLAKFIDMIGYQGATPEMAAAEAQKWLFNYSQITPFIKTIKNAWWGSPFLTFQYKVFPRMIESFIKNPLTLAKYPLVFEAIEQYTINKYHLTDKEVALAKKRDPWNFNLPLSNFKFITSVKIDENGRKKIGTTDMGFTFPFGEIGEVGSFGNMMGFLNGPVPKIAPVIIPLITGQPYKEPTFGREFKTRMEKINYLAEQLLPPLAGYSGKKILLAAQGKTDYYGTPYDYWLQVMRNVFGIKYEEQTTDVASYKLYSEMEGTKKDISIRINKIAKDHSLTTDEKQKRIEKEVEMYKKEMNNIFSVYKL